jgi:hypothetical protein
MEQRVIVKGGELPDYPGCWQITERLEGEPDSWAFIRKPDGTYWEIGSVDYFSRRTGGTVIEIGDWILNRKLLVQCEQYYTQLLLASQQPF